MDIKSISSGNQTVKYGQRKETENEREEKIKDNSQGVKLGDAVKYEKTENHKKKYITYDKTTVERLKAEADRRYSDLRRMVEELLRKQGMTFKGALKLESIEIDEETQQKAIEAIEEGGEYSVDAVATRIIDFAKAISGGDKDQIPVLKNAIKEGFEAAKKVFGGNLPDICEKTYHEVMERLDAWEKEN
ncbi:hypothetical protein HNQ80_000277 [Anaerosolibacter carboniphilus]|uniref:Uncharacterized protein n=1 Tax=Anaerosolibacter carboniphilus TaxID=1417629 RepID=A0A841KQ22_9FIRM|nr:hypothetical protein [Anaerosolibacter carboniphilus]MBB6214208.1 hypothetical protein [Anaerosolibacter carboniphilus]